MPATKNAPAKKAPPKKATAKRPAAKKAAAPRLLSGGNPQIAKGHGDAPVQAWIAAAPDWKGELAASSTPSSRAPCPTCARP